MYILYMPKISTVRKRLGNKASRTRTTGTVNLEADENAGHVW